VLSLHTRRAVTVSPGRYCACGLRVSRIPSDGLELSTVRIVARLEDEDEDENAGDRIAISGSIDEPLFISIDCLLCSAWSRMGGRRGGHQ
jgi:hypothetical protein